MRRPTRVCVIAGSIMLTACGPRANIPAIGVAVPGALSASDSASVLARTLAPILYTQRDEPFDVERVVAVLHPTQRVIAFHLLWRDDAHGAWAPFTKPTDQEVVWIGYDAQGSPSEVWTYWHSTILHTDWRGKGRVAIDVQWGKHGSMPRGMRTMDLPFAKSLDVFYLLAWIGMPDLWLGNTARPGPWCFCHGYGRYASFTQPIDLAPRVNAVVRSIDPRAALVAVFSREYANKPHWPHSLPD